MLQIFGSSYQDLVVNVEKSDVVSVINGGDRTVSSSSPFSLTSSSFDPDELDLSLDHQWSCSSQLSSNCYLNSRTYRASL